MATLVLTAVGSALGGPIGAAIGAVAGQAIDARLFAPKARQGPRLADLALQTSAYGTPLPKLFGTMRIAGTVIWAAGLRETRSSSGNGKGRPRTVSYSYSASFAVALSARPIRAVRRIWADGKLLRGSAGDFKAETGFRLYTGDEEQAPDPLIVSAEGEGGTPAYRGLAYAVFEDLQLADYGNRIPSLSFEVEADEAPVAIGAIAAELAGGALRAGAGPAVTGYAAGGASVRSAIEQLVAFVPLSLVDDGQMLRVDGASPDAVLVDPGSGGVRPGSERRGGDEQARRAASAIPSSVTLGYSDPARDYQAGLQRAFRSGPALLGEQHALPIAIPAASAKQLAEARLAALWAGRTTATLNLNSRHALLRPGTLVRVDGRPGTWRIERWTFERMVVRLQLVGVADGEAFARPASAGRPVTEPDLRHGPTTLRLIELPSGFDGRPSDVPRLFVAAAGAEPGWRRAALIASLDDGASWTELGSSNGPAVMGSAEAALPPAGAALFDNANAITITMLNDRMELASRSDADLVNGANLALLGEELIQFGTAQPLGAGRYRVRHLLRGRLGSEWACGAHQPGETFVLLDRAALTPVEAPLGASAARFASSPRAATMGRTGERGSHGGGRCGPATLAGSSQGAA
jgi:hypothetical protein